MVRKLSATRTRAQIGYTAERLLCRATKLAVCLRRRCRVHH